MIRSATDWTPTGAFEKLQEGVGKTLFLGYLRLYVISEDAAKYIMKDLLQLSDRSPDIRTTANLVITTGKAEDVLSTADPDIAMPPGRMVSDMTSTTKLTGVASPVSIQDFDEMLAIGGLEAVAPRVNTAITTTSSSEQKSAGSTDSAGSGGSSKASGSSGSGGTGESDQTIRSPKPKEGHHWLEGMAVFKEDRMAGWLNRQESLGWAWLTGKKIDTFEMVNNYEKTFTKNILAYRIVKSGSKIKPRLEQGKPVIEVNLKVEANLRKYLGSPGTSYLRPNLIPKLEKALAASITADIRTALKKGQKDFKSDIFGFGFAFYRKYPYLWHSRYQKEWPKLFPDIPVRLKVKAKVSNTGTNVRQFIIK